MVPDHRCLSAVLVFRERTDEGSDTGGRDVMGMHVMVYLPLRFGIESRVLVPKSGVTQFSAAVRVHFNSLRRCLVSLPVLLVVLCRGVPRR